MTERKEGESFGNLIERQKKEAEERHREMNVKRMPLLEGKIERCHDSIKNLDAKVSELESKLLTKKQKGVMEKILYSVPLFIVILFVGFLVYRGWAEKPTVSIDFNVGEIIGGSLIGIGALIAGVAYAFRRIRGE